MLRLGETPFWSRRAVHRTSGTPTTMAGGFNMTVSFTPAATVSGKVAGCPNNNWTGINPVSNGNY